MEYVGIAVEIIVIVVAIVCFQSKKNKEVSKEAAYITFGLSLLIYTVLGLANLVIGRGVPFDQSNLDNASSLALIYVVATVCLINKKKTNK